MTKTEILGILKTYKKSFDIKEFVLFGSYSNGTNHKESDIDIAYILKDDGKLTFDSYLRLEEKLTKSLKTKIDLMNFNKLNPLIKLDAKKDFIYV
ncbi:MAG: nucleotidyltransferase domain-containing protein [Campylobacterota bacterium]|nr:nucleotidyltransferase domain-containing protein [Campylobacterota bacterium]